MAENNNWGRLALAVGIIAPIAIVARAEVFLSEDQAGHLIFPAGRLQRREVFLSDEQVSAIEKASGERVRNKKLTAFVGPNKDTVFVDQVLGKHEFITVAVGVASDGTIKGVEILEYRETYGYQVRHEEWRKQFLGKSKAAPIKLGADIKNISGATLSSAHVSAGVRRLVQTYEVLRPSL